MPLRARSPSAELNLDLDLDRSFSDTIVDYQAVQVTRCVIHRTSCARVVWDYVISGLALYASFAGPVTISIFAENYAEDFTIQKTDDLLTTLAYMSLIVDLCFLADVVVNFFTSYFLQGEEVEVYNLKMIAKTYLKSWFMLDLLCAVPTELAFLGSRHTAANIVLETLQAFLRLFKIFKIIRLSKRFKQGDETMTLGKLMYMRLSRNQRRILGLMIAVLYICHFITCVAFNI